MTLRNQALSGVRWTSAAAGVRTGIQVAQLLVLARLLTPVDFGNMSVVVAVVAFLRMFADFGVSNAIIHRRQVSADQLSSLYWLNITTGACLALLLLSAGTAVASFYGEPVLRPLFGLAGMYLLLECVWNQLRVMAEKELRFAALAYLEMTASAAGFAVSVAIALLGGGVYALMGGALAGAAAGALMAWPLLADGWRPRLRLNLREIREFLRFGAYMAGNNLANTISLNMDVLLGARLLGAQSIGLYSVPKNLCLQITAAINPVMTRVALPVMARSQEDELMLRNVYLQIVRMTASANFPVFVAIAMFAPEIVRLAFGSQWDDAVPLLQVFAWWALLRSTGNPIGSLLMARGRADLSFKWNLFWLPIFAVAVWLGSQFGAHGIALGLAALGIIGLLPNWYFLVRPLCGAGFGEYFRELGIPLALSAAAALVARIAVAGLVGDLPRLAVGLGCGGVAYVIVSFYFNRSWSLAVLELLKLRLHPDDARRGGGK